MSGNDSAASVTESGNQLILWTPASGLGTSGIVAENESETLTFTYTATADRDITAAYDLFSYDREVEAAVLTLEQAIRQASAKSSRSR